jgi:hypothetical protein
MLKSSDPIKALTLQVSKLEHDLVDLRRLVRPDARPDMPQGLTDPFGELGEINKLVEDFSASAAGSAAWESIASRTGKITQERLDTIKECVLGALGPNMHNALTTALPEPGALSDGEHLVLKYAFQMCILHTLNGMLEKFCVGLNESEDETLRDVSAKMQHEGELYKVLEPSL